MADGRTEMKVKKEITAQNEAEIRRLEHIIDTELERGDGMDTDLIDECVEYINELRGNTDEVTDIEITASYERFKAKNKDTAVKPRVTMRRRAFAVTAAIVILISAMSVIVVGYSAVADGFENAFQNGGQYTDCDGVDYVIADRIRCYDSVEEFFRAEDDVILYPTKLPDGLKIKRVSRRIEDTESIYSDVDINFTDVRYYITVKFGKNELEKPNYKEKELSINGLNVMISDLGDRNIVIAQWIYNGDYYHVGGTDLDNVIYIIENLKVRGDE